MKKPNIKTIAELKNSGYLPISIKDELFKNFWPF